MASSGWLTRSIEQASVFDKNFSKIRNITVRKVLFLFLTQFNNQHQQENFRISGI